MRALLVVLWCLLAVVLLLFALHWPRPKLKALERRPSPPPSRDMVTIVLIDIAIFLVLVGMALLP